MNPHVLVVPVPPNPLAHTDILTPKQVAAEYQLSERTLANWRSLQKGPRFLKFGERSVRYRRADLEAFIAGGAE
ncbi:helix-turn-helix domain-containing protein [Pseudoxanthomonas sp.]|uniref:helix-turn-helix transcriptional regulator n=1 Tax=Pseudoxanthomonas sp. TaxID=1871049 RepID=UPI0026188F88|nr:helix-turn-helix domain-containing protein [Pseudoxanthomonas sp.]WDS35853.1 MAG: helix-turn-helix domain-containing protein [Pseudoxanthomonas sp.]